MERTHERRDDQEKRVPLRAAVELSDGAPEDAFEADAVNLSRGGMLLRSPCLPDLGARLRCSFEHPESGAVIVAEGEVVWAQLEGEASGEIGLAFTGLDPRTEMLIEQIIADHGIGMEQHEADAEQADAAVEPLRVSEPQRASEPRQSQSHSQSLPQAPRRSTHPSARVTNLSLEGISEPLETRVTELIGDRAVFEQVLPLLQLGRAVAADAPELAGRRGAIASVELRMIGHVPTLAVTVTFESALQARASREREEQDDGEFHFSSTDVAVPASEPHDTEPDLESPSEHTAETVIARPAPISTTATEFGVSSAKPAQRSLPPRQLALEAMQESAAPRMSARSVSANAQELDEPLPAALASQVSGDAAPQIKSASAAQSEPVKALPSRPSIAEPTTVFPLGQAEGESDDDDLEHSLHMREPGWKPLAVQVLRGLQHGSRVAFIQLTRLAIAASAAALPHLRFGLVRMRAMTRQLGRGVAPQLGTARRLLAAQLTKKPRRTTAGASAEHDAARHAGRHPAAESQGSLGRMLAIGALTTLAAGLGVYALIPTSEPETELHRAVDTSEPENGATQPAPDMTFTTAQTAPAAAPLQAPPAAQAPMPVPSAASVPKGSPFAVDVREGGARAAAAPSVAASKTIARTVSAETAAVTKSAPKNMRFGAANAPARAQRFELRMSKPIAAIEGLADAGGFTIIVHGTLSLDRAGPISASHRAVARAMVLNKGDRAELTIRFVDGKRPSYQVRAEGATLHLAIEEL